MTVWPSARVAASIAFSVPITDTNGKRISAAAQPAGRRREVVAVAVLDRGAQRAHRLDVEVDRPPADPVAARVADDDPPEPGQQRPEEHEAGAHPGGRLERDEQPLDVARGDLVDVVGRVVDDDPEVAQGLGHDPHVLDLGDVGEPAALAGQGRRGEQLEGRVLGAADRHGPLQRPAALDPEDLAGDRLRAGTPSGTAARQPRSVTGEAPTSVSQTCV